MKEVFLPKSTKKSYYFIFKNIGLVDLAVIGMGILIAGLLGAFLPVKWLIRLVIGLIVLMFDGALLLRVDGSTKGYQVVGDAIRYLFKPQKLSNNHLYQNNQNPNLVVCFDPITKTKTYIGGVQLSVRNLNLLNEPEQINLIHDFSTLMRSLTVHCKLIKIDEPYNFDQNLNFLVQNHRSNQISQEQKKIFQTLANTKDCLTPVIYYCFYAHNQNQAEQQLQILKSQINFSSLSIHLIDQNKLNQILNRIQTTGTKI